MTHQPLYWMCCLLAGAACSALAGAAEGELSIRAEVHTAAEVLVVANGNSAVSMAIAKDYAARRGVTRMVVVRCADSAVSAGNETISLADYQRQIQTPVMKFLHEHAAINFIVLTKGLPIRVSGGITGSRDEHRPGPLQASVDSYLAAIDYSSRKDTTKIQITGSGATGLTWLNRYWKAKVPFSHAAFGGYLVTRLDGYSEADAKALVTRAMDAERQAKADGKADLSQGQALLSPGKVLLDMQPLLKLADIESQPVDVSGTITDESDWGTWNADLVKAGGVLKAAGVPVELDQREVFVGDRAGLLGYFSWGSNDPKFTDGAYQSLRFAPGSIGDTAVSTSGRTFLPTTGGQSLITDLIAHGITGVKGYTDEPLLQAIASPSIAMDRYVSGFTLAESFYAASRFVGWTDVVIGDPLCRWPALRAR